MSKVNQAEHYPLNGQKRMAFWLMIPVVGLIAGTGLLWWRYGANVFARVATAALAMCF